MNRISGALLNYLFNEWITHFPCHAVRLGFLRIFGRKINKKAMILMHARLIHFWNLSLDENVIINQYSMIDCRRFPVHIGPHTDIGPYCRIWTLGHDPDSNSHALKGRSVKIGHHVWMASGVTVLPGITINDGAVIASGSVVTRDVERMMVVAGNPAKVIRKRTNDLSYELNYSPLFD